MIDYFEIIMKTLEYLDKQTERSFGIITSRDYYTKRERDNEKIKKDLCYDLMNKICEWSLIKIDTKGKEVR